MELKLRLGDTSFMPVEKSVGLGLTFDHKIDDDDAEMESSEERSSAEPSLHLNLLPSLWPQNSRNLGFDVNRPAETEDGTSSSPNSGMSSFRVDRTAQIDRASSRASDEDELGAARKKLRLSKEQSAFLEESFKEHNTLNPKQKIALAKQLNLRPRQVEVWFQNRRARTKLKQTEVDCEYLKQCCEKLTDENRRLQKELAELRALKTAQPFYMNLPATTLSMCPSCERIASTKASVDAATAIPSAAAGNARDSLPNSFASLFSKPCLFPFTTTAKAVASPAKSQPSSAI